MSLVIWLVLTDTVKYFFQSDCNNFYIHQQGMGSSANLVLSVFKILAILVDM